MYGSYKERAIGTTWLCVEVLLLHYKAVMG